MDITYKALAIFCLSTGLLAACSSSDDDSDSNPVTDDVSVKYQGSYAIPCTSDGASGAFTSTLSVTGLTATVMDTDYSDDQCVTPATTSTFTADISFPGGTQTTDRGVADHINTALTGVINNGEVQDLSTVPAADLTIYDIVILDGTNLYLGDTEAAGVGISAETRPTTLQQIPYVRQ